MMFLRSYGEFTRKRNSKFVFPFFIARFGPNLSAHRIVQVMIASLKQRAKCGKRNEHWRAKMNQGLKVVDYITPDIVIEFL